MDYLDFQILNEADYLSLSSNYQSAKADVKDCILDFFFCLVDCENYFLSYTNSFNQNISRALMQSKEKLNKIHENLKAVFNLKQNLTQKGYFNFNLFSFLNQIVNLLNKLTAWENAEKKQYFKLLINSFKSDLAFILNKTLSTLETSEIAIHKFM